MRFVLVFVFAVLGVSPVLAADVHKAEHMLDVMHVEATVQQMRDLMISTFEQELVKKCIANGASVERCQQSAPQLIEPLDRALADAFKWESVKQDFAEVYAQQLTDQEIDASIAFYSSPEGQSLLNKMPKLMQAGAEIGRQRMVAVTPRLQAEFEAVTKKLKDEEQAAQAAEEKNQKPE